MKIQNITSIVFGWYTIIMEVEHIRILVKRSNICVDKINKPIRIIRKTQRN